MQICSRVHGNLTRKSLVSGSSEPVPLPVGLARPPALSAARLGTANFSATQLGKLVQGVIHLTEPSLSYLGVPELVEELEERIRAVLGVDTATILLMDESGTNLVAYAAKGLEEEVEQRVTVPVGKGFAGRIAAERRPLFLPQVDERVVVNPLLIAKGLKALLGIPLVAEGDVIGVLHVGSLTPREFKADELTLLEAVSDRIAAAILSSRRLEAAERAIQARDDFLSTAAHELKTPITTLKGYAQLMQHRLAANPETPVEEILSAVGAINVAASKIQSLIEQILDVARIERGGLNLAPVELDLSALVRDTVEAHFQPHADRIELDLEPGAVVCADPLRAEQVAINLVDNAVRHAAGSQIVVSICRDEDSGVRLRVKDDGPGIPEDERPHLFDRLTQGSSATKGLGLGLHITKQIAELHGGSASATFPREGGSVFEVTFPSARR